MTIYFYANQNQKKICKQIADILEDDDHICVVYTNIDAFYMALANMKKPPDLLILDYLVFDHDLFCVYHFMQEINFCIPLLFYNDPYPTKSTRLLYWLIKLNSSFAKKQIDVELYKPVLQKIVDLVNSDRFYPYIALFQQPLPFPEIDKDFSTDPSAALEKKLPATLRPLFCLLYNNRDKALTTKELLQSLSSPGKKMNINILYTDIFRLRSLLRSCTCSRKMDIIHMDEGYRLVIIAD